MAQVRQIKSVSSNDNSSKILIGASIVLVVLLILIGVLVTQLNAFSAQASSVQPASVDKTAAIAYCTEKTNRYAKDENEFKLGVKGCMEYDDYAKSLISYK